MVITHTLTRSEIGVSRLHTFLGECSVLLPEKDWIKLGKPSEIVVQVSVPRERDSP